MLIKAILHTAQRWCPSHSTSECSKAVNSTGRSGLVSRNTLLLMANSGPSLEVPLSAVARTQFEFIRRGQVKKHERNRDGFDPHSSRKSLQCVELFPATGGGARALKFSGERRTERKPSSKRRRTKVPSLKGQ